MPIMTPDDDDFGRQVSPDEKRLWSRIKSEFLKHDLDPNRDTVPAVKLGNELGIHPERTRQLVKTWSNDGLVSSTKGDNYVRLTDAGLRHNFDGGG